ncbi:MAG: hypothetical protein U0790_18340 [Isosphaeraceae bacterium]
MGWKASCILISERNPQHLVTMPTHDPERARRLISDLGLGPFQSRGMTTFDVGIFPETLVIGAYEGAWIIGHPDIATVCLEPRADPMTARILAAFPDAAVLRIGLNSVVNLWGDAYFEQGKLVRAFGGSADDGVVLDEGDLLDEERPHFERSVVRDGQRFFFADIDGQMEEFDTSAFGEELTFEIMGRFLGCRPDRTSEDIDPIELPMESFEPVRSRRWWWLFPTG